jgi:polyether ionophore transport system permease protein
MTPYAGTWTMLRLALRRDRVLIPVWALVLAVSVSSSVAATADLYPDREGRVKAAQLINDSPATLFMYGPITDPGSLGAIGTFKMLALGAIFVSLLGMFLVRRHTRGDEEIGRLELVAPRLGKRAALTAGVSVATIAVLGTCLLTALANTAVGLPFGSSLAFGAAWAASGLFFVALTGLVAQLTQSARACAGIVATVLGASYALRGLADTAGGSWEAFNWISPLGWTVEMHPYAGDQWWVLIVPALLAPIVLFLAFGFQDRRDLGEGVIATRPGPARAPASLSSSLGLAWRLQRGTLLGWAIGVCAIGLVIGSIVPAAADIVSPEMRDFLEKIGGTGALEDVFLSVEFAFMAIAISGYAIAALLRMPGEEGEGRAELVLATAVPRRQWYAGHVLIAVLGSGLLVLLMGLSVGLTLGTVEGGLSDGLGRALSAALAQLPAVWVLTGVTAAFFGLSRRLATAAWAVLVGCLLLGQLGDILGLPRVVMDVSPFAHSPQAPAEDITAAPLVVLAAVALGLVVVGMEAFRRRDLAST